MSYLENELSRIEGNASYSVADVRAGESWKLTWEGRWTREVREKVHNSKAQAEEKSNALYEQVRDVQRSIDADKAAADAGEIPATELMNRRRVHLSKIGEFERRLEALENGDALLASMQEDPVEYMSNFYEKWAAFRDRRPSIDDWIQEDREKRNRR